MEISNSVTGSLSLCFFSRKRDLAILILLSFRVLNLLLVVAVREYKSIVMALHKTVISFYLSGGKHVTSL
jgi:hypothetical protein